jgi:NADPH-dependent curcumin reductase CurA
MNRQVHLLRYPDGPSRPEDFGLVLAAMPVRGPGELLLRVECLGLDPFPRLRMRADSPVGPPMPLRRPVEGRGLATVIASDDPNFPPGCHVAAETGWQQFVAMPSSAVHKLPDYDGPLSHHLSTIGPSGLTGFFTTELTRITAGETIVIAPAAGSVGVIAAQIARARGATVIGLAATEAQCAALTPGLGFAAATTQADALSQLAPNGVQAVIDGVGGALHEALLPHLAVGARLVLLGFIAAYNDTAPPRYGNVVPLIFKRAELRGFLLADHLHDAPRARAQLTEMIASGALKPVETVHKGLASAPAAFAGLFQDAPPGKQIVLIDHEE